MNASEGELTIDELDMSGKFIDDFFHQRFAGLAGRTLKIAVFEEDDFRIGVSFDPLGIGEDAGIRAR